MWRKIGSSAAARQPTHGGAVGRITHPVGDTMMKWLQEIPHPYRLDRLPMGERSKRFGHRTEIETATGKCEGRKKRRRRESDLCREKSSNRLRVDALPDTEGAKPSLVNTTKKITEEITIGQRCCRQ